MEPQRTPVTSSQPISRRKAAIILIALLLGLALIITLLSIVIKSDENQFGKFIKIQNYSSKIKNLNGDMRDAMESYLYNVTVMNIDAEKAGKVGDALIREGSDSQDYNSVTVTYSGSFIVDMQSIKQSYEVQYSYTKEKNNALYVDGGNAVVVSCLEPSKLIYGEFDCKDIVSKQSSKYDVLLQYLPYENFSFKLSPDATQGEELVVVVTLDIPQIDLSSDAASKAATISLYKNEVKKWFDSKGLNWNDYKLDYNYDDAGNVIRADDHAGD